MSENSKTAYRYGFYLDPQPGDPVVIDLNEAETNARKLSVENGGVPVAIWDSADKTLRLFAGYEDFIPVGI